VYAGIADNCAANAISAGRRYLESGVDAVVALLPSYYPLNAFEMRDYFRLLADEIHGSIVLYNIPPTTHMSIPVEIVEDLSHIPNITGFKDSENDLGRIQKVAERLCGRPDFSVFMGVAAHTVRALKMGFDGSVPSSGNLVPGLWRDLYQAARHEDWESAEALQARLDELGVLLQGSRSLGQSLAALKAAMHGLDLCEPHMLPPLQALPAGERETLTAELSTHVFTGSSLS
jgi:4-hydroxy-tetrahydrodipicolinate synthase